MGVEQVLKSAILRNVQCTSRHLAQDHIWYKAFHYNDKGRNHGTK